MESTSSNPIRKTRRSRGRGLRTNTGCAVCRRRHMKCDEVKPTCGPCSKGSRPCDYGLEPWEYTASNPSGGNHGAPSRDDLAASPQEHMQHASFGTPLPLTDDLATQPSVSGTTESVSQLTSPQSSHSGPGADSATRWFGLLAHDASEISIDLHQLGPVDSLLDVGQGRKHSGDVIRSGNGATSSSLSARGSVSSLLQGSPKNVGESRKNSNSDERTFWQAPEQLQLQSHELVMFRRFATGVSLWIDLFDPLKHFSTFVPHLALRNEGLMRAVLALGARHLSIKPTADGSASVDRTASVQYYYETLQYLQSAMRYASYKNSLELLATVLVVSTYEMIDGAGKGWERHLKGVFWIQRSREIHGESGGLEQAIWWAWLRQAYNPSPSVSISLTSSRQDTWAAYRERRRCYSFYKPTKRYRSMTMWDMASRIVYILSQSVNYCSDEEKTQGESNLNVRMMRAKILIEMLSEWRSSISIHFNPLPIENPAGSIFRPIWIQPQAFAVSVQMYNMARILLLVHQPSAGGYLEYLGRDKSIVECIDVIGGIALNLTEDACRMQSTQCLFTAGLYCTDETKRKCIAQLIEDHARHTGWPTNTDLAEELRAEWFGPRPA